MTLVTGTVQDLGYDGMEGTLWARPARFRSDGQVVLAPERKPYKVVDGVVSADLAPGPAVLELQVGSHARGTFEVVIPDTDISLADLLDTVFPWEPAQVSLFVAEREAAQQAKTEAEQAKADAEQAATLAGTAKTGAELAAQQTGQDRTAVSSDKDTVVSHVQALAEPNDAAVLGLISEGADTATKTALDATYADKADFGRVPDVVLDGVTNNRVAIQAALDLGGTVRLPAAKDGVCAWSGEVLMTVPGTTLDLAGVPIRQLDRPYGLFHIIAPDCSIIGWSDAWSSDGKPDYAGLPTSGWQGSHMASRWAAVTIFDTAHRTRLPYVRARRMGTAVRISGWNYTSNTRATTPVEDVEIGTIDVDEVEFGLAAKATKNLRYGTIRGTAGNALNHPRPAHLAYFADDDGGVRHHQPVGGTVQARGGTGHAAQFKGLRGGTFASILADECDGILNVMESQDVEFGLVQSLNDKYRAPGLASIMFDSATTLCDRIRIRQAFVQGVTDMQSVRLVIANDCVIDSLEVRPVHETTGASATYDVQVQGNRNTVNLVNYASTGSKAWRALGAFSGSGHRFKVGTMSGVRVGVDARGTDTVIDWDPDRITLHPTDGIAKAFSYTTHKAIYRSRQTALLTDAPGVLAADTFSLPINGFFEPRGLITGQVWEQIQGSWVQDPAGGRVKDMSGGVDNVLAVDVGQPNVAVSVIVNSRADEGLAVRVTDANNLIYARLRRTMNQVQIVSKSGGTATVLETVPFQVQPERRYTFRFEAYDNDLRFFIDGVPVASHTLATAKLGNKHGLYTRTSDAWFRNFQVVSLT